MFGLSLGSEHRILKFLEFPELTGVSLVIHKEPLSVTPAFMQTHKQERPLDSLRMGLVTRRPVIKAGNFQPPPPTSQLMDTLRHGGEPLALILPVCFFHPAIPGLHPYNEPGNVSVALSPVSCSLQTVKPEEGVMRTPDLQPVAQKYR